MCSGSCSDGSRTTPSGKSPSSGMREAYAVGWAASATPDARVHAVPGSFAAIADSFLRPVLGELRPYEPGKPVEEVQRELGLERVVKLASNEGPYGPFPAAVAAIERSIPELNRYPDGGAYALRAALADLHRIRFE